MTTTRSTGSLEGRSIIVTGGGSGLGAACAARLVADGAIVTICGRSEERQREAAKRIGAHAAHGGRLAHLVADVTVEEDVARLVATAIANGGALHGVVANAGGGGTLAPYHLRDTSEFLRVLHLNLLSTMLCVKHSAPALAAAGGGAFIAMSSIAAGVTHPHFGAYPVAKAAVETLIRNAADEYGRVNVRFNAVAPGFIETEIMEVVPRESAAFRSYVENTPLGGVGRPEDVAELVRFLIGPEARWITGETIWVDGGHHLRRGPDYSGFVGPVVEALRGSPAT